MSNIPAAVHFHLRADDQQERHTDASVLTPRVGLGLRRGVLDCLLQTEHPAPIRQAGKK